MPTGIWNEWDQFWSLKVLSNNDETSRLSGNVQWHPDTGFKCTVWNSWHTSPTSVLTRRTLPHQARMLNTHDVHKHITDVGRICEKKKNFKDQKHKLQLIPEGCMLIRNQFKLMIDDSILSIYLTSDAMIKQPLQLVWEKMTSFAEFPFGLGQKTPAPI